MKMCCLVALLALAACGDDDGSADAGSDAGSDAAADAGSDSGSDAATDSGSDSGSDPGSDAGSDSGSDAGPSTIACGDATCVVGDEVCCRTAAGATRCAAACEGEEVAFACDGAEDCGEQICCQDVLSGEGGAMCAACEGAFVEACHPGDMCGDGSMCCPMGVCLGGGCD